MFGISFVHFIILFILALVLIGPDQLPEVARTIGRFINEIRRSTNVVAEEFKQATRIDNTTRPPQNPSPVTPMGEQKNPPSPAIDSPAPTVTTETPPSSKDKNERS